MEGTIPDSKPFEHDDARGVFIPFWVLREAPNLQAAVLYQQYRFWSGADRRGQPRAAQNGWWRELGDDGWLAIPDDAWGEFEALSPDQVFRARRALVKVGWIEVKRSKIGGRPVACVRTVYRDIAVMDDSITADSRRTAAISRNGSTAESRNPPLTETKEREKQKEGDPLFAAFWVAYPLKTAKGAARKAWPKALATVGGNAQVLIDGAERLANDPNRIPKYTPHPATWLNGERWEDGALPSVTGATPVNGQRKSRGQQGFESAQEYIQLLKERGE